MKPIKFPEVNVTYAENQPEYIPLPGHKVQDAKGEFIFCMKLSFTERVRLLFTGKLWCSLLTFNHPLTPSFFSTKKSDLFILPTSVLRERWRHLIQKFYTRCKSLADLKHELN